MGLFNLSRRVVVPELMDAPDLDPRAHAAALAGLRRLNRAANAPRPIAKVILRHARAQKLSGLRILDVACGGGDVSVGVAQHLRRAGVAVTLHLTDMSPVALQEAAARAAAAGIPADAVGGSAPDNLPGGPFDVVMCTLFLHHLSREEAVATLREMGGRATQLVVACDLRRNVVGYLLAWVMCRLVSRSAIVHFDGPVSVRAGWTLGEMSGMAKEAGLNAEVRRCFPARILVVGERPRS